MRRVLTLVLLCACSRAPLPAPADGGADQAQFAVCVSCDAVRNPCPGLGLVCEPTLGLCMPKENR